MTSAANGTTSARQDYDPWGKVRLGANATTTRNYTGQRLDGTGLLFYNARYYDPNIGRFISADSVVPTNASGSLDGLAHKALTVDYHELPFAAGVSAETRARVPFQQQAKDRLAQTPGTPQQLNRYSYVLNRPVNATDPTGHTWYMDQDSAVIAARILRAAARELRDKQVNLVDLVIGDFIGGIVAKLFGAAAEKAVNGALLRGVVSLVGEIAAAVSFGVVIWNENYGFQADQIDEIATLIENANVGGKGVALTYVDGQLVSLNRSNGDLFVLKMPPLSGGGLPEDLKPGVVKVYGQFKYGVAFGADCRALLQQKIAKCGP